MCRPAQFKRYERLSAAIVKFTTALSVATIAHMYECAEILEWATIEVFTALERRNRGIVVDTTLMMKVYQFAARHPHDAPSSQSEGWFANSRPPLLLRTQEIWADLVCAATDPVDWLVAARSLSCQDQFLQAVAYFYILKRGPQAAHSTDSRLTGEDGRRLVIGAYNLNITAESTSTSTSTSLAPLAAPSPFASGHTASASRGRGRGAHTGVTNVFATPVASLPSEPVATVVSERTMEGVWQGSYDPMIRTKRDQLWRLFNDAPWRMNNVGQRPGE